MRFLAVRLSTYLVCCGCLVIVTRAAAQPQERHKREVVTGTIEATPSKEKPLLFVSIDLDSNGKPDRGYLIELEKNETNLAPFKRSGTLEWHFHKSIAIRFASPPRGTPDRLVFRAKSNTEKIDPPLSSRDKLLGVTALLRFLFVKPMTHAELAPLQLRRTTITRLPQ